MGYSRSRAKCVALQYPSSATRGVKEAPNFNKKPLDQNLTTPLQEKEIVSSKALNFHNKELAEQLPQSESGMFYELSSKKGMECEKYQDCSWFLQSPVESNCNSKLSLVDSFDPFIDADEFVLPMQCADAQNIPWGEKPLEVFNDDILEEHCKMKEKNRDWIFSENFYPDKVYNNNAFDYSNINFSLKKTDSVDSMKNISSTNPAKVIPISYKEKLSNANYGLSILDEIKKEVKLYSPDSCIDLIESDDNDLNIGREEIVEEIASNEDIHAVCDKERLKSDEVKLEVLSDTTINENICKLEKKNESIDENNFQTMPVKYEPLIINKQNMDGKFDLNLDIAKLNFEQTINVNTPDLDFMDLVEFINQEMCQESNNSTNVNSKSSSTEQVPETNNDLKSAGNQNDVGNNLPNNMSLPQSSKFHQTQSAEDNLVSTDSGDKSTVDFNEISNTGVSIAERIKTTSKRRTTKNLKDFIDMKDEGSKNLDDNYDDNYDDDDDDDYDYDDDDDDDYDYKEDLTRRKGVPVRKRVKSSVSESSGEGKNFIEDSSYRERRDKNNEASRRSRQNRKARERHMYETLEEEEKRNVKLKAEADVLEKQVTSLRQLLLQVVLRKGGAT